MNTNYISIGEKCRKLLSERTVKNDSSEKARVAGRKEFLQKYAEFIRSEIVTEMEFFNEDNIEIGHDGTVHLRVSFKRADGTKSRVFQALVDFNTGNKEQYCRSGLINLMTGFIDWDTPMERLEEVYGFRGKGFHESILQSIMHDLRYEGIEDLDFEFKLDAGCLLLSHSEPDDISALNITFKISVDAE